MPLAIPLLSPSPIERSALFRAFGVPDDGTNVFEIGFAATGSTCLLQSDDAPDSDWWISIPLLRAGFTCLDLFPPLFEAAKHLQASWGPAGGAPLETQWKDARRDEIVDAFSRITESGSPALPTMPAAELLALRAWMITASQIDDEGPVPIAKDFVAFATVESGEAQAAALISGDPDECLVPPLHLFGSVLPTGVELYSLADLDLPRTQSGFIQVNRRDPALKRSQLTPDVVRELRSVSPIEVIEHEAIIAATTTH